MGIAWVLLPSTLRQSWKRLTLTAVAIGLGVGILLAFSAVFHALVASPDRSAWRTLDVADSPTAPLKVSYAADPNLAAWRDQPITVVSVRVVDRTAAPALPGVTLPDVGEVYLSPALAAIERDHPADGVASRFGTRQLGVLPASLLASPDELVVLRGMSAVQATEVSADPVDRWVPRQPLGTRERLILNVVYLGVFILLFPVVLLVSIATQLGSVQREQRYAALRLVGASRRQITMVITLESLVAAVAGLAVGAAGYLAAQPLLREIRFVGRRFWPEDLAVPAGQAVACVVGAFVLTVLANWWGLRHVHLSPLGVVRRQSVTRTPRWWRVLVLLAGFGVVVVGRLTTPENGAGAAAVQQILVGVVLISLGLVLSGPWLTRVVADVVARRTGNPVALLGSRYLTVHSRRVFRSVSGVVLALFAGSFYLSAVSGIPAAMAAEQAKSGRSQLLPGVQLIGMTTPLTAAQADELAAAPYLRARIVSEPIGGTFTVLPCEVATTYLTRTCPPGARLIGVTTYDSINGHEVPVLSGTSRADLVARAVAAGVPTEQVDGQKGGRQVVALVDPADVDRLRSDVVRVGGSLVPGGPSLASASVVGDNELTPVIRSLAALAYAGMAVTLLVAVASLVVSTVGGLLERRRPLTMLRLAGMPLAQLRRMVLVESAIPLVVTSVVAAASGVLVGFLFMQMVSTTLDAQVTPSYLITLVGGLALAVVAIRLTLPMLARVTDLSEHRTE